MKSEMVAGLGAAGAGIAFAAHDLGLSTKNQILDILAGAAIAGVGYFIDMDGVGDVVMGAGIGYFLSAVL